MKPVIISAHWTWAGPLMRMRLVAIRCAAPLSATILPSIAPSPMTSRSDPSVSPSPFWMAADTCSGPSPEASPTPMQTMRNARNGVSRATAISRTSATMPARAMARSMGGPCYRRGSA